MIVGVFHVSAPPTAADGRSAAENEMSRIKEVSYIIS
jgi:hypothetical protein